MSDCRIRALLGYTLAAIMLISCAGVPPSSSSVSSSRSEQTRGEVVPRRDFKPDEFRRFVALGESTTAGGWSASRERCWVSRLGGLINDFQYTPVEVLNMGIGGNVISVKSPSYEKSGKPAANERLGRHVIEKRPDLLIISYGLNDARGGTPLPLFKEEMRL